MDWEAFCSLMSLTCMREPLSLPGYVGFTYFEFWSIRSKNGWHRGSFASLKTERKKSLRKDFSSV
jgi:hypothetical protein